MKFFVLIDTPHSVGRIVNLDHVVEARVGLDAERDIYLTLVLRDKIHIIVPATQARQCLNAMGLREGVYEALSARATEVR